MMIINAPRGAQEVPQRSPSGAQEEPKRSPRGAQEEPNVTGGRGGYPVLRLRGMLNCTATYYDEQVANSMLEHAMLYYSISHYV